MQDSGTFLIFILCFNDVIYRKPLGVRVVLRFHLSNRMKNPPP